ncbi:TlpA family protein disulfide reductase [Pedobacter sp. PAMC26386]|nr:TlpA family protein disulfide reductase [Pedobacter sp. PAMC26386]
MKKTFLIIILLSLFSNLIAQEKSFKIQGEIEGSNDFKYALLYTASSDNRFEVQRIVNNHFAFSGKYSSYEREGEITSKTVFLTNKEKWDDYISLVREKTLMRRLVMEPQIDIVFDLQKKVTKVNAGELNKIQSVFSAHYERYLNKLDSIYIIIDLENLNSDKKTEKKREFRRALYFEEQAGVLDLIKKYPNSEIALSNFTVFTLVPLFTDGRTRATFNSFSQSIRQSKYGKRLERFLTELDLAMVKPNMINKKMPPFELAGLNDQILQSKDLLGKYTLVDFWASWCAPCRAENPTIKTAFDQYHQKGFNVIAISIDQLKDKEKWVAAIEKDKTQKFTHLFNPGGTSDIARDLKINAIPANYLLDAEGKIIAVDLRGEDLTKKLKELFPE